jgi:hypothetical protein
MTDHPEPHYMTVYCYNSSEGCTNTVTFFGIRKVRKICPTCQESGIPSERPQAGFNFGKAMRKVKLEAMAGLDLGGAICCAVTVWPKTIFGGRVAPCPREG